MGFYIRFPERLLRQAMQSPVPPEAEIERALAVLANNPVRESAPFAGDEIRLIAAYREALRPRTLVGYVDSVWQAILDEEWAVWPFAVHEAYELDAFTVAGANPFDVGEWRRNWQQTHLQAARSELQYLQTWAQQLGIQTSALAIEMRHPIRGLFSSHGPHLLALQRLTAWAEPMETDLIAADFFWQKLKERKL